MKPTPEQQMDEAIFSKRYDKQVSDPKPGPGPQFYKGLAVAIPISLLLWVPIIYVLKLIF